MKELFNQLDPFSRRQFVLRAAQTALGVSILPIGAASIVRAAGGAGGKAKRGILLYMSGGMSHMDTFDPKPGAETAGKTQGIDTGVAGVQLAEFLPELAKRFKDIAVIRSMNQKTGDHRGGSYWVRTSYEKRATIVHPTMGPWAQTLLGKAHDTLPDSVVIGGGGEHPGSGFFGPALSPLPIGDPDRGVQNSHPYQGVGTDLFEKRMDLMNTFDQSFRRKFQTDEVKAYTQFYDETLKLMKSKDLDTFDLSKEKDYQQKVERYGNTRIGKGAILAKRLVSAGVRFVEVVSGGWDMHNDLWGEIPSTAGEMDKAISALIDDLKAEGLFEETIIAVATEFGRTPIINANAGRDHHPRVFSTMLAGGGIVGGQVYGASDEKGIAVKEDICNPQDFNATIAYALGLDLNKVIYSPSGRPFLVAGHTRDPKTDQIVSAGKPIMQLFS